MSMENFKFGELLIEQMKRESSKLYKEVYPKFKESKLSREAKGFLADDLILSRIYNNVSSVNDVEEKYLIFVLEKMYDDVSFEYYRDNKLLYLTIPIFERLLNSKNLGTVNIANKLFFKLYCALENNGLFSDWNIVMAREFDFHSIFSIEHLQTVRGSSLSMKAVVNFLNFVNLENARKKLREDSSSYLYYKKLNEVYSELYRYFNFVGLEDTVMKFDSIENKKDSWKIKYSDKELVYCDKNYELVKFYYSDELKCYTNRYYEFKEMEESMMKVRDEQRRKEVLLASFCYSEFCDNTFFKSFDDVELTMDDLVKFVKKYEDSGCEFSQKQANMLLKSFVMKYFSYHSLDDLYLEERAYIRESYQDYYKEDFTFTDFEFIDYFNRMFKKGLWTFNFDGGNRSQKLDYYMLRAVLDDKYIGFDKLEGTKFFEKYLANDHKVIDINHLREIEEAKKQKRQELFDKFYPLVSEYNNSNVSLMHFLRKNVDKDEEDMAKEVIVWTNQAYCDTFDVNCQKIKENTIESIKRDLYRELLSSPYNKRADILKAYNEYIISDGVSDIFTKKDLYQAYKKSIMAYTSLIRSTVMNAIETGDNLYAATMNFNISPVDIKSLLKGTIYEQYKADKQAYNDALNKEFDPSQSLVNPCFPVSRDSAGKIMVKSDKKN